MSQNIKPSVWGPHGWKFLHYVSLGAPDKLNIEEANHYRNFYESLQYILPCKSCAKNYAKNIKDHPIQGHLETRDQLVRWVIEIHNRVNRELGKREYSVEEALPLYLKIREPMIGYLIKFIVLILLCFALYAFIR